MDIYSILKYGVWKLLCTLNLHNDTNKDFLLLEVHMH